MKYIHASALVALLPAIVSGADAVRVPPEGIADERNQPGESVAGIGIVLDDVEGEPSISGLVRRQ